MARRKVELTESAATPMPATTLEGRDEQLTALAIDLVERQLRDGTASSQTVNHYLKRSSPRERLELEKLRAENKLLEEKANSLASAAQNHVMYEEAIQAMKKYQGTPLTPTEPGGPV